jgi:hypothetical protein
MTDKTHPSAIAESGYRRGYQQGAMAALRSAEKLTNNPEVLEPLVKWIEDTLFEWRFIEFQKQNEFYPTQDPSIWPPKPPAVED